MGGSAANPPSNSNKTSKEQEDSESEHKFDRVWIQLASGAFNAQGWSEKDPHTALAILESANELDITVRSQGHDSKAREYLDLLRTG